MNCFKERCAKYIHVMKDRTKRDEPLEEATEETPTKISYPERIFNVLLKHYLPLSYIFFVAFALLVPQPGAYLDHKATQYICVVLVFFLSGIYLRTNEMKEVFVSYKGAIYGITAILAITPLLGGQLTSLLDFKRTMNEINSTTLSNVSSINGTSFTAFIGPLEYKFGLILFFSVPCTLTSGVVMVQQLNGHVALALFLTVVSNLIGVFTVPLFVKWMVASSINVKFDLATLILRLCLSLLLPLVIGKIVRCIRRVREYMKTKKVLSKVLSITFLDILVWVSVSSTRMSGGLDVVTFVNALFLIAWSITIHVVLLLVNAFFSWAVRLPYEQTKTVILLCSQKTITVAMAVTAFLPPSLGDRGLMVIAQVVAHITILVFDSLVVSVWLHMDSRRERKTLNDEELQSIQDN